MMVAEQALFGDRAGGHALLAASVQPDSILEAIRSHTDLAPDRPPHVDWSPYITGHAVGPVYVVMYTAPDEAASRPGMVLTQCVFLPLDQAIELPDIGSLLQELSRPPSRAEKLSSLELKEVAPPSPSPVALENLLTSLLNTSSPRLAGWLGAEGFEDAVRFLWRVLTPAERRSFAFGFAFNPRSVPAAVANPSILLARTSQSVEARWAGIPLIDGRRPSSLGENLPPAVAALLGYPEGEDILRLKSALQLKKVAFAHYPLLQLAVEKLKAIDDPAAPHSARRTLVHAIGHLAPSVEDGGGIKREIIQGLIRETKTADDLLGLRNLDVSPFPGGIRVLRSAAGTWVDASIGATTRTRVAADADLIRVAGAGTAPQSWSNSVIESIRDHLKQWSSSHAATLWRWWSVDSSIINMTLRLCPRSPEVDADLVDAAPDRILSPTQIRDAAEECGFLLLHAHVAAEAMTSDQALAAQLALDPTATRADAFQHLMERVGIESAVEFVVRSASEVEVLVDVVAALAATDRAVFGKLDARQPGWRVLWARMVARGADLWEGVPEPAAQRDALLDLPAWDEHCRILLRSAADTPEANLLDYAGRRSVWARLPADLKGPFLNATAEGWRRRARRGGPVSWELEVDLAKEAFKPELLLDPSATGGIDLGIRALQKLDRFTEKDLVAFVDSLPKSRQLTEAQAVAIGTIIAARNWSRAAKTVAAKSRRRKYLYPAVRETVDLLGALDQLLFTVKLGKPSAPRKFWWEAFEELVAELLPTFSELEYFWSRAGGSAAELRSSGSGVEQVHHALQLVRRGRGVSPSALVTALRREFPENDGLETLESTGYELGLLMQED